MSSRDPVEQQIQMAIARGDFDDLPGTGQPLSIGDEGPGWWARRRIAEMKSQDQLEELARHIERSQDQLWVLGDEASLRAGVDRINGEIDEINSGLPQADRLPSLDVERTLRTWRLMFRARRR